MTRFGWSSMVLFLAPCVSGAVSAPATQPDSGRATRVVSYFAEWGIYQRNFHVADLPADQLTDVIYAFIKINREGEVELFDRFAAIEKQYPADRWDQPLRGNFNQFRLLKKKHPKLNVLMGIGGWSLSGEFSNVALTERSRARFIGSAVKMMKAYGLDGLDIDWEYPVGGGLKGNTCRPEDKENFTLLMRDLRVALDDAGKADGRRYLLTMATPAGFDKIVNIEVQKVHGYVDWFNVMSYDFHGAWDTRTNHPAPLYAHATTPDSRDGRYCADAAIREYLRQGVPAEKLLLGFPLYARAWGGVPDKDHGLFQPSSQKAKGTWKDEDGVFDYRDICGRVQKEPMVFRVYWDDQAKATYVYAPAVSGGLFSSFEDHRSIQAKIDYIQQHKLGGAFFWEASGDVRNGPDSIIRQASDQLRHPLAAQSPSR